MDSGESTNVLAEQFDVLCDMAIGKKEPLESDLKGEKRSELFLASELDDRGKALKLYVPCKLFEASVFRGYLKFKGLCVDNCKENFDPEEKAFAFCDFENYRRVKAFLMMLGDIGFPNSIACNFCPLYFTGFGTGLAILCVQDPSSLIEELKHIVRKALRSESAQTDFFFGPISFQMEIFRRVCHFIDNEILEINDRPALFSFK